MSVQRNESSALVPVIRVPIEMPLGVVADTHAWQVGMELGTRAGWVPEELYHGSYTNKDMKSKTTRMRDIISELNSTMKPAYYFQEQETDKKLVELSKIYRDYKTIFMNSMQQYKQQQPVVAVLPEMQQPGMQQPGMPWMQQPGMQQAGMPWMQQPGMQQPAMQQAGMQQSGMPWMQQPGMPWVQQPGMQQPGMPWMQQAEMQQAGMQQPAMQQAGMQQAGMPWMQQPGMPWVQQPGMQQPGMPWMQQAEMQQAGMQQPAMQQAGMQQRQHVKQQSTQSVHSTQSNGSFKSATSMIYVLNKAEIPPNFKLLKVKGKDVTADIYIPQNYQNLRQTPQQLLRFGKNGQAIAGYKKTTAQAYIAIPSQQ
jgi:hypothetical protein